LEELTGVGRGDVTAGLDESPSTLDESPSTLEGATSFDAHPGESKGVFN